MYHNSGRGGYFFSDLYDWCSLSEMSNEPSTRDDFLKAGLTEKNFIDYLVFVRRLYAAYFANEHGRCKTANMPSVDIDTLWTSFSDFCIDLCLIPEYVDKNGKRMPCSPPNELEFFQFIYGYPECPDEVHVCDLDEFRFALEFELAHNPPDWYLNLRFATRIIAEDMDEYLMRYEPNRQEMVQLTKYQVRKLQDDIASAIAEAKKSMDRHCFYAPNKIVKGKTVGQEYFDILREQRTWMAEHKALEEEYYLLSDVYEEVMAIAESGVHENTSDSFPDDTLYVYKGKIICERDHHRIEQVTAILKNRDGNDIELNVSHCLDCEKFFLHYNIYQHYRDIYGTILGNIRMAKNGNFDDDSYMLADESPLRLCGYSVSRKSGLSQGERQTIIASCIESGAMTKEAVIRLLNWFVEVNGAKAGNEQALEKWCEDLDFALAYGTPKQNRYQVSRIAKYDRNRFYVGTSKPKGNISW